VEFEGIKADIEGDVKKKFLESFLKYLENNLETS
jgi:hypothetical protein